VIRRHVAELGGELTPATTANGAVLSIRIPMTGESAADPS